MLKFSDLVPGKNFTAMAWGISERNFTKLIIPLEAMYYNQQLGVFEIITFNAIGKDGKLYSFEHNIFNAEIKQ